MAIGGRSTTTRFESLAAEQVSLVVGGLGDAVGVEDDLVPGLKSLLGLFGGGVCQDAGLITCNAERRFPQCVNGQRDESYL